MNPGRKRPLNEASPHTHFGIIPKTLVRILLVGLLTICMATSLRAQSRPPIQWMRGDIASGVRQIALSPDGLNVAMCGADGTVKIRRISDGMLLQTLVDSNVDVYYYSNPPVITTMVYADAKHIVTGSDAAVIHLWDLDSNAIVRTLITPSAVNSIALSPNGTKLAAGMSSNDIWLWNFSDFSPAGTLGGHTNSVRSVAFSSDNQTLASGSSDGTVRIWNTATASGTWTMTDGSSVGTVVFAPNGITVCSGDNSGNIKVWNASTGAAIRTIAGTSGFNSQSVAIAISPDGSRVTGGFAQSDTKLHSWLLSTGVSQATMDTGHPVYSVAYTADGSQLYCTDSVSHVSSWNGTNLSAVGTMPPPFPGGIRTVAMNPAGSIVATGSSDGIVRLWDSAAGAGLTSITPATATQINALAFSPDGSLLAIAGYVPGNFGGSTGILWLYNIAAGTLRQITVTATSVAFNKDGTVLAAGVGNAINVYNTTNFALLKTIAGHTSTVNAVAISPDGATLASASSDNTVKTWNLSTYALLKTLSQHTNSVDTVTFSRNSLYVVDGSSDKTSILWRIADGAAMQTFTHVGTVQTAVISPDQKQVITGSADRHLKVWDFASGAVLYDYTLETGAPAGLGFTGVISAVYSPDGKFIAYGRNDSALVVAANPLFTPLITGLSLNPSTVVGGTVVTGTVTLNSTTLTDGAVVSLSTDNPAVTSLPLTSVPVPLGSATVTFTVNTSGVSVQSFANITASLNGSSASAQVTVNPPTVTSVSVSPTSVRGGQNSTGTVTLSGPAPAGGQLVDLKSSNTTIMQVPARVTVPVGAVSTTFAVTTNVVPATISATITATLGTSATATLTITPPTITALSTSPANLRGGQPSTGTVTISDPAPTKGIVVTLASNNATVASTVASVTIPSGATTATFAITTHVASVLASVTFTATFGESSQTTVLTVTPPTVTSVTLSPSTVKGGTPSTGTVTISDPAPTAGISVALSSANTTVAGVPATVTVASGNTTATFTVTTTSVTTDTPVVLTGTVGASSATGTLTVQAPFVAAITVNPPVVRSFHTSTVTVYLDSPAPTGGISVNLYSSNTAVATVPASVIVPAGATTATTPVRTLFVPNDTRLTLAATLGISNASIYFTVLSYLPFDFDKDGYNDLVLQNPTTGAINVWDMQSNLFLRSSPLSLTPALGYKVVGVGDFSRDSRPDLVFQNLTTNDMVIWYLNNATVVGSVFVSLTPSSTYAVAGVGTFNGDDFPHLLFQNVTDRHLVIWYLNGGTVFGGATLAVTMPPGYQVAGVGDFGGPTHADIVLQNPATGGVQIWQMNGSTYLGTLTLTGLASGLPSGYQIVAIEDVDRDGATDLVFANTAGQLRYYFLSGTNVTSILDGSATVPAGFTVVGPH